MALTRDKLVERYDRLLEKWLDDTEKAPLRGKYNRLSGSYSKTDKDFTKKLTQNIRNLNMICESRGWDPIHDFEEEPNTLKGKAKQ